MQNPQTISIIFTAISVIFIGVVFHDYLKAEDKMTISRKIWLRMAFIFAAVGIVLFFAQIFLR
jgi:H+/Cl- antiporter ClcA